FGSVFATGLKATIVWTLTGVILATALSPFVGGGSDGVLRNYHDDLEEGPIYAFGNNQNETDAAGNKYDGPREPRIGGYNRPSGDEKNDLEVNAAGVLDAQLQQWPRGASAWIDPSLAKLTGVFWGTRKQMVYAGRGIGIKPDGASFGGPSPEGHYTIYPTVSMSPKEVISQ